MKNTKKIMFLLLFAAMLVGTMSSCKTGCNCPSFHWTPSFWK